ncbi:hypothetical protein [Pseudonocardia kunmingensis]|uniref:Uncharacterized protein n=1 Tax=Pseudonocardia kunmingensis TaxID=630975 RepID=A0A543CXM5_9PSEU|nr:hypothetical protein [Pseudonocardia kunmingensis]TQM01618.1 hypothetical protein FB558_8511 [Pseudonocardia kunmingensis]
MAFEVFTKRMVPLANQPYVTVQKRGTISMNKSAHALLGDPGAVELLYDATAKVMGFRAVAETVEHAYAIRAMGGKAASSTFMVSGRAFFRYYGIDTDEARRYPATIEDGVLCVDLSQPGTVVTSNRNGTGAGANTGDLSADTEGQAESQPS